MALLSGLGKIIRDIGTNLRGVSGYYGRGEKASADLRSALERRAAVSAQARSKGITSKTTTPQAIAMGQAKTAFTLPAAGGGGGGGFSATYKPGIDLLGLREKLAKQLGIGNLQKQYEMTLQQAERERALLEALPEDIRGRTADFLMGAPQRRRLEAAERDPIARRYQGILTSAAPLERSLTSAQSTLREMLALAQAQEQLRMQAWIAGRGSGGGSDRRWQTVNTAEGVFDWNPYTGEVRQRLGSPTATLGGQENSYEALLRAIGG